MKPFYGHVNDTGRDCMFAIALEGVDPEFPRQPMGRQTESWEAIKQFKQTAKRDWVSAKVRKGMRGTTEIKRWVKAVNPKEFFARWLEGEANDDSIEIFYKL